MIVPVILCGGNGTRLWPLSSNEKPKQLLPLFSENSLCQETVLRFHNRQLPLILVCGKPYADLIAEQIEALGIHNYTLIIEPAPRDTAPAIALAAQMVRNTMPDASLLVVPSDHLITNTDHFFDAVEKAKDAINKQKRFVLFGITPTRPETGYGYIKCSDDIKEGAAKPVSHFIEKPSLENALELIKKGYLWNSGMFVIPISLYLQELEQRHPEILLSTRNAIKNGQLSGNRIYANEQDFLSAPGISVDYAVMQETEYAAVVELTNSGWSDIGSWDAVWDLSCKDSNRNVCRGKVIDKDCTNSFIFSDSGTLITVGLNDYIVVQTETATLIMPRSESQDLKTLLNRLDSIS